MKRSQTLVLLTVAMSICLVVAACSFSGGTSGSTRATPTTGTSPAVQLSPAWTAMLQQIGPNGEVSLATALQAYTLAFGPLPGGPTLPSGGGLIPSGTLAVRMILRHYHDLTPAQQQAVLQQLGYTAPASAEAVAPAQAQAGPHAQPLAAAPAAAPTGPTPVPTDGAGTAAYRAMLDAFIPKYNGFLSYTLTLPQVLSIEPAFHGTTTGADTAAVDALGGFTGPPAFCRIRVNPDVGKSGIEVQRFVIAHELMHCYQAAIQGSIPVYLAAPDWLIEGSAEWAGALVSGATSANSALQPFWRGWLASPGLPLFARAYSAIGFYALLDDAGISPWSVLPAMLTSQNNGINNLTAYHAGTQSAPQEVLDDWASGYERNPSLGLFWNLTGPGIIPTSSYSQQFHAVTLANGGLVTVTTPAYTVIDYHVTAAADVVEVSITGTSRLHDSASFERVTSANGNYCTKQGGCACPQGSPYQGPALTQLTGLLHLAVTGGPAGATGIVRGVTLQQFCSKQKTTSLPPITLAFCQQILSIAEADQIMHPSIPTKAVVAATNSVGGACDYVYAPGQVNLILNLENWLGPVPLTQQDITAALAQAANQQKITVTSRTFVSGVGDQAAFFALTAIDHGNTVHIDAFYVLYGRVAFDCNTYFFNSAGPADATQEAELQQCAQLVLSRLDP